MSHFVAYILQFQEIIVYRIPQEGGEGVYSQPKVYKNFVDEMNQISHRLSFKLYCVYILYELYLPINKYCLNQEPVISGLLNCSNTQPFYM